MLIGKRVKLAALERKNIDLFLKWFNDPEITQYLITYRPLTRDMEEEWFDNLNKNGNRIVFSIQILKENGESQLIGNCGVVINWKDRVGILGITIGDVKSQGMGYGTEAMELLVKYCFTTLNLNRVELEVHSFNLRGLKLYKKLGFIEEGRRRKATFIKGKYHDEILMGLLREEWKE